MGHVIETELQGELRAGDYGLSRLGICCFHHRLELEFTAFNQQLQRFHPLQEGLQSAERTAHSKGMS